MAEQYTRDAAKITLTVGNGVYDGWLRSEVERSIEAVAGTFSVPVTLIPGQPPAIKRGEEVSVQIGGHTVITGYVLAAEPFYNGKDCGMMVAGRDRTGDLVRSSAQHQGGQWRNAKLDRIAADLLKPYGIGVVVETDIGAPITEFKLYPGEPVVDALARAAKLRGVLVVPDAHGRLLLTKAGTRRFRGAIRRGWNVIEMASVGSDEGRHSHYIAYGQRNVVDDFETARSLKAVAKDEDIKRYLPLQISADGNTTQAELETLVQHTMRVRRGHSMGFRYVVEGWTFEGHPWPLNERVPIYDDVAGLDGAEWLVASVRHRCDLQQGDVTELLMRPVEAYDTAPLKTKVKRKHWGGRSNPSERPRDGAQGGR